MSIADYDWLRGQPPRLREGQLSAKPESESDQSSAGILMNMYP
eukprot:COSAG06_NODE_56033_length_286_cov_2.786096_1_plen_42_part_01